MPLFGNCGRYNPAFDYLEPGVASFLVPLDPEAVFRANLRAAGARVHACNMLVPAGYRLYGPGPVLPPHYLAIALRRAAAAGARVVVVGAGGARRIPEGWTASQALDAFAGFLREAGDVAAGSGILLAVEPLNRLETDLVNTVANGAALVREVNHPAVRLLADQYHMDREGEPYDRLTPAGDLLVHVHVAVAPQREAPRPGDRLPAFFAALRAAGYDGGISVECTWSEPFETEAERAAAYLRETWASAG
jgi:sugar phosphate isomerase/epimerase